MSKKFKSKWFRVAVEGATTDKRIIERSWLEQAAKNFNRTTYGARIWLEHMRGLFADSAFPALGDVLALKTEEVEINGKKKLALLAQLEPTEQLLQWNKKRQKVYTSIEIDPEFADTKEAYMVGIAVTDSPASLGTDLLAFAQKNPAASPYTGRHSSDTSMFTEAVEVDFSFEEETDDAPSLFTRVKDLLTRSKQKDAQDDARFADVHSAVSELAEHAGSQADSFAKLQKAHDQQAEQITALTKRLDTAEATQKTFGELLDKTPGSTTRPAATGGDTANRTDC